MKPIIRFFIVLLLASIILEPFILGQEENVIKWDIFKKSEKANIMIHENWIFYDMHSARVIRYTEFDNVSPINFSFREISNKNSEKKVWDYEIYESSQEFTKIKNIVDEEKGILKERIWYIDNDYIKNEKIQTELPKLIIENNTQLIIEKFNIANSLKYIGPEIPIIKNNDFWFPFEKYEFSRNISKSHYPFIYSAKLEVPKLISYSGFFKINRTKIEGVSIPKKKVYPIQIYKNGTIYKELDPIIMTLIGSRIRPIMGPYSEGENQIIIIPPNYMISKDEKLGEISILPQNLTVVGIEIKRPLIIKIFYVFITTIIFILSLLYINSIFYKNESKHLDYLSVYLIIIAFHEGLISLFESRPLILTVYDMPILIPFITLFFFLIIKYSCTNYNLILKILKFIIDTTKRLYNLINNYIKKIVDVKKQKNKLKEKN